jgi:hypothetical protein
MPSPHRNWPQYPLRTLVWLTVLGPPLLALICWWLIWAWPRFDRSLWLTWRLLTYPAAAAVMILVGISVLYYPVALSPRVEPPRWQVILLWCAEFLALWHWLYFLWLLFGWLLIWGDRYEPPGTLIASCSALAAAAIAAMTSKRLISDSAGSGYLAIVIFLTLVLLLFATPFWLWRLLR